MSSSSSSQTESRIAHQNAASEEEKDSELCPMSQEEDEKEKSEAFEEGDFEEEQQDHLQVPNKNNSPDSQLFTQAREAISLRWDSLNYFVEVKRKGWKFGKNNKAQTNKKQILFDVEGAVQAGELLAIMGPSGAGKTTMLDLLAKRTKGGTLSGSIYVNNEKRSLRRKEFAYVQQKDLFIATTTVRETLYYAAMLQLRSVGMTMAQKKELVEAVLDEMGLRTCADTQIGGEHKRGISGGEAKRAAIGAELITNPQLLFLDEPTTGLDSAVALSLVDTLRRLAEKGRTIVCTIHQPRFEIFSKFDKLLLLSEGKVVYFGSIADSITYFSALGFKCPRFKNPADHVLDLVRVDKNDENCITSVETVQMLQQEWGNSSHRKQYLLRAADDSSSAGASSLAESNTEEVVLETDTPPNGSTKFLSRKWTEFWVLWLRTSRDTWRDPMLFWISLIQYIVVGFVTGFLWFQLPQDQESIRDWLSLIYFSHLTAGFPIGLAVVATIPPIRPLLKREHEKGMYSGGMLYLVMAMVNLPTTLFSLLLYTVLMYWTAGLRNDIVSFVVYYLVLFLLVDVNYQLGLSSTAVSPSPEIANLILSVPFILWTTYSGFFILPDNIAAWFIWLYWSSPYKYGFDAVVQQQFGDASISCETETCTISTETVQINGQQVNVTELPEFRCQVDGCMHTVDDIIDHFDFTFGVWEAIGILAGIALLLRVTAFILFAHVSHRV